MNFFLPPPHLFWTPSEFSVLRELGYHFHFIASVTYKKKERKKEMAWPRSYQNSTDQFVGWREGTVKWARDTEGSHITDCQITDQVLAYYSWPAGEEDMF